MFDLDYSKKTDGIVTWLRETVRSAGFAKVVIAVSGGVDSAVSLNLAVRALGKENVYVVLLPYGDLGTESLQHGQLVVGKAGLAKDHVLVRDIQEAVDTLQKTQNTQKSGNSDNQMIRNSDTSSVPSSLNTIRKGNSMARVRMIYLFDLAKQYNALVVGTENKSEYYLGYFTRFGDEASDIEPIRSLYKTQVWEMAKYLGVPKEIIEKKPSANLWEGQSDEGEFGFSYEEADKVLYLAFEEYMRNGDIVATGIDEKVVRKVLEFVDKNNFKHHVPKIFE